MREEIIKRNVILTIIGLLIFFVLSLFITSYSSRKTIENQLVNISQVISNQLKSIDDEDKAYEEVNSFTNNQDWLQIVLANSLGNIVKDSSDDSIGVEYYANLTIEELELVKNEKLTSKRIYIQDDRMYFISFITEDLIMRTSVTIDSNSTFILNSLFYMLVLIVVVIILSIFYSRKTSKLVTDAFDNISSHLKTIIRGEYKQIDTHHQFKEVEESLSEINEINKNIYSSLLRIKNEHDKINFIINNMKQGMLIIDENGKILIINDYARKALKIEYDVVNSSYYVMTTEIADKITIALKKKNDVFFDYKDDNERIYAIFLSNLNNKWNDLDKSVGLLVMIIMDVTEDRTNDEIKAEFIANASHELKTPITSIRGFSELLISNEEQFDDKTKKYLHIIFNESNKMKSTIEELLYLSNLEYRRNSIDLNEKVYFKPVIEELISNYETIAQENNITIETNVDNLYIVDSALLLKHLIGNLLENAIRYNKTNGKVLIKVKEKENKIELVIEDTGIGIEEKNYGKIFDRFYRIETSHNRNTGGTGLGLNLVKQICVILNAKIEVNSVINVGTSFIVTFNKIDD